MKRACIPFLEKWLNAPDRKPLVIRGARQVGKTWLVRHLAQTQNRELIEINFEKHPQSASFFASNDPAQILLTLGASRKESSIDPLKSLLFLDEIQAAPELLAKLRWFAEDMPQLPVIAAGSLLEFTLAEHSFSMPVGRISYMHLEPLSFTEFLWAHTKDQLVAYLAQYQWEQEIPIALHEQLITYFKEYIIVGGMPQAVAKWVSLRSLQEVSQIQYDIIATYRDDFAKYSGRIATERLDEVMLAVPKFLGEKFVYSNVNPSVSSTAIKRSLELLCKARVCHKVQGCAANGVPLGAEILDKYFKAIFLDVGLCSAVLDLSFDYITNLADVTLINKGGIAEQVVGQLLRTINPEYKEPALYYWQSTQKGSNAEVDYVIQHAHRVVPIEVKAGSTGTLKSLHYFMKLKKPPFAIRINSQIPTKHEIKTKDHEGELIEYTLFSLPFYLISELRRLLPH